MEDGDYTNPAKSTREFSVAVQSPEPAKLPACSWKFGNPAPIGLCGFALTTFVLSVYNAEWFNISVPNVVTGLALYYGGVVQLIGGIFEWIVGNTIGSVAFMSYGGFWLSFGTILIPSSGIKEAFTKDGVFDEAMYSHAIAFYLLSWCIFTLIMLAAFSRTTRALVILFILVAITFLLLSIGDFTGNRKCKKAGGWIGVFAALDAWYCALAALINDDPKLSKYVWIPVGPIGM